VVLVSRLLNKLSALMKIFKQRNVVKAVEQELRKEVRQSNRS
jgi:hypothetical protein